MTQPIDINETFLCKNCGFTVPLANKTCRNHCPHCLFSLHVDAEMPGDRLSTCHGLMEPVGLDQNGKKGFIILHKCLECGRENRNFKADDDDTNAIIELSKKQNLFQN